MIYATMCVGKKWVKKHKDQINKFSKTNTLHILTDDNTSFENCICHHYTREVFSYYEKINLILNLSKEYKERIYYIDADWIRDYDTTLRIDDEDTIYSYSVIDLKDKSSYISRVVFEDTEVKDTIMKKIGIDTTINCYMGEAILLVPYNENIDDIISDSKILQKYLEETYHQNSKTHKRLNRYKDGIGYAEGWGITALAIKYNIPIKESRWRKKIII